MSKITSIVLHDTESVSENKELFLKDVIEGLQLPEKRIPMKYVYDQRGSQLYTGVEKHPNYYPFKCDKEILKTRGLEMLQLIGREKFNLVDLGAGDGLKTQVLLQTAVKNGYNLKYIPLDISLHANNDLANRISREVPELEVTTVTAQFEEGIDWILKNNQEKNVYYFLGGTISNQSPQEIKQFVDLLKSKLKKGDMFFVTADLCKDPRIINLAYAHDDSYKFTENLLVRINRELDADFDCSHFYQYHFYDPFQRSLIGSIISSKDQQVRIGKQKVKFHTAEIIHGFLSHKFMEEEVIQIFEKGDMKSVGIFKDSNEYMGIFAFEKN